MTRIPHDNSDRENHVGEDTRKIEAPRQRPVSNSSNQMAELRTLVVFLGGPQEARKMLSGGSHQSRTTYSQAHAENLETLVELLAGQHAAQAFGKAEDGE